MTVPLTSYRSIQPWLLTPRALRYSPRRRTMFIMPFGMYMFMACAKAMGVLMILMLAMTWDMLVFFTVVMVWMCWAIYVWPVLGGMAAYRRYRRREQVAA